MSSNKINLCPAGALVIAMIMALIGCKDNHIKGQRPKAVCNITFVPSPTSNPTIAQAHRHLHMIVLVHGTILPYPSWGAFWTSTKQKHGSWYQNYLNQLRCSNLYTTQPIGPFGLHLIDRPFDCKESFSTNQLASYFLTQAYRSCSWYAGHEVRCYTFGWDGRLDHNHRLDWGIQLYHALNWEIGCLKEQFGLQDEIMVDIYAHSHGGNVALNMVHALHDSQMPSWHVNRLVLLGTPVQHETASLIQSPLFKRVYNVYSKGDGIQNLDFISTNAFGSSRRFDTMIDTQKEPKLVQVEVKADHKRPTHVDFFFFKRWRLSLTVEPRDQIPLFVFVPLIFPTLEREWAQVNDVVMDVESRDQEAFSVQLKTRPSAKNIGDNDAMRQLESLICCAKQELQWPIQASVAQH